MDGNLQWLEKDLQAKHEEYDLDTKSLSRLKEEIELDEKVLTFYRYYNATREIEPNDLVPDENRTSAHPPKDFGIQVAEYKELVDTLMANLYDYLIHLSLKKHLIPLLKPSDTTPLQLTCLDAGCSIGGLTFRLAQQGDISKVYGVDLSPSFIAYAKERQKDSKLTKQELSKLNFVCQDASVLSQFKTNEIDIGFCNLVLHEMPKRVPMNILCELSRICKYMVVMDWIGPHYPWNEAGKRNRRIEFTGGPHHFNGFLHFVKIGGIEAHVESLQKYRNGIKIRMFKKIDQGTMGLYILDTANTVMPSKL
eukprot:209100_1